MAFPEGQDRLASKAKVQIYGISEPWPAYKTFHKPAYFYNPANGLILNNLINTALLIVPGGGDENIYSSYILVNWIVIIKFSQK